MSIEEFAERLKRPDTPLFQALEKLTAVETGEVSGGLFKGPKLGSWDNLGGWSGWSF